MALRLWIGTKNVFRENGIFWVAEKRYEIDTVEQNAVPDVIYNLYEKRLNHKYRALSYNQASPIGGGGGGYYPPSPPRDGPKNQLTFLFKAFFSFFFANHILHAVKCIKMNFFST